MTVAECIDLYDREHPNDTDMELKMRWLKTVDNAVINEVVKTHWERRGTEIDEETYFDFTNQSLFYAFTQRKNPI